MPRRSRPSSRQSTTSTSAAPRPEAAPRAGPPRRAVLQHRSRESSGGPSLSRRRVVVTGLGIVSPLGSTVATAWEGIVNGRSGIGLIDKMDLSAFPVRIGGQAKDFVAEDYLAPKDVRRFDPFVPFGVASATQAIRDSGFEVDDTNCSRIGVAMGAGIGGLSTIEDNTE